MGPLNQVLKPLTHLGGPPVPTSIKDLGRASWVVESEPFPKTSPQVASFPRNASNIAKIRKRVMKSILHQPTILKYIFYLFVYLKKKFNPLSWEETRNHFTTPPAKDLPQFVIQQDHQAQTFSDDHLNAGVKGAKSKGPGLVSLGEFLRWMVFFFFWGGGGVFFSAKQHVHLHG